MLPVGHCIIMMSESQPWSFCSHKEKITQRADAGNLCRPTSFLQMFSRSNSSDPINKSFLEADDELRKTPQVWFKCRTSNLILNYSVQGRIAFFCHHQDFTFFLAALQNAVNFKFKKKRKKKKNRKLEIDLKEYLTDFPECYKMLRNMSGLICSFTLFHCLHSKGELTFLKNIYI